MEKPAQNMTGPHGMVDGVTVRMGGRDWIVAPLTLGQLRHLWSHVKNLGAIGAGMEDKDLVSVVALVTASLQRNYPQMTEKGVEDLLDLGNAGAVLSAVLTGSGLQPVMGEAVALGALPAGGSLPEPNPRADLNQPSGPRSMVSSPQPADTATPS